jgi:ATP-dependent 26S proteasome regulatory subunit
MQSGDSWLECVLGQVGGVRTSIERILFIIDKTLFDRTLWENGSCAPPKGLLIHGSSGTGKTRALKAIAGRRHSSNEIRADVHYQHSLCTDLLSDRIGAHRYTGG